VIQARLERRLNELAIHAKGRRWIWGIALVLLGAAATVELWNAWPRERLLLEKSKHIADQWNFRRNEVWISDHEIAAADIDYTKLRASIVYTDFRSGKTRSVALGHLPIDGHVYILPSPDGRWALRCDSQRKPDNQAIAVEVQTGRHRSWPERGDSYHYGQVWLSDSRRWLEYSTIVLGYLTIHDVDGSSKSVRIPSSTSIPSWPLKDLVTSSDHLLIVDEHLDDTNSQTTPPWTGVDVYEYRLLPTMAHLGTIHVTSPPGVKTLAARISPDGDHIIWTCSQSYVSPLAVLVHRWIKRVPAEPQQCFGLWVSRINGNHLHEIGHIRLSPQDDEPRYENPESIFQIHWLPDGKRFSFVYKDTLYTTSLD
jgi:hypothetical protein